MARLRKNAPLKAPVRVIQRKGVFCLGGPVLGYAWYSGSITRVTGYRIVIDSRLSAAEKWEAVLHEYAHCLDRETRSGPKDVHDSRWGQCFARAYRASMKHG